LKGTQKCGTFKIPTSTDTLIKNVTYLAANKKQLINTQPSFMQKTKLLFVFLFVSQFILAQSIFPTQVKDLHPSYRSCFTNDASDFFETGVTNNKLVFRAYNNFVTPPDTNNLNLELFVSDGTNSGTTLLKEINPNGSSYLNSFYTFNNKVYFYAYDGITDGMWVTNGSSNGTNLLKNIRFRAFYNNLYLPNVFEIDSLHFIFAADTTATKTNLYISDGTTAGTQLLKDFDPSNFISHADPGHFVRVANNRVVFTAKTASLGEELYVTDGTAAGTTLLMDINPGTADMLTWNDGFTQFHSDGQRAYFFANDGVHGAELWTSDGTIAGTMMVKDINVGIGKSLKSLSGFATLNGFTYFIANTPTNGTELYKTDGTTAGTSMVFDFRPGVNSGVAESIVALNNKLIFAGTIDGGETNVYALEPSTNATQSLINLLAFNPPIASDPFGPTLLKENIFCDKLYFNKSYFASPNLSGFQIAVTDGLLTGTGIITDSLPAVNSTIINFAYWGSSFAELNNQLLYRGKDLAGGWELYKIPLCAEPNTTVDIKYTTQNQSNQISIFPNPSKESFKINIADFDENLQLDVYDISGKTVLQKKLTTSTNTIIHQLNAGVYFIKIGNQKNTNFMKLVVTE
jgi:ELWxxDGT repeat protein